MESRGKLEKAISLGLWGSKVSNHKGIALWAVPAGRACTGSSIAWANWWPAPVTIHLVCIQRPHPVCPWGQLNKQEFVFTHFSFNPGYKNKWSEFSTLFLLWWCLSVSGLPCCRHPQEALPDRTQSLGHCASCGMKATYHCGTDHHLQKLASPTLLLWTRHTLLSVLPVLLSILESMATVGMEAPGNRTVPHSHICIFLWWRGPSSLIASGLWSALGTPSCNEYNATLPKG